MIPGRFECPFCKSKTLEISTKTPPGKRKYNSFTTYECTNCETRWMRFKDNEESSLK